MRVFLENFRARGLSERLRETSGKRFMKYRIRQERMDSAIHRQSSARRLFASTSFPGLFRFEVGSIQKGKALGTWLYLLLNEMH